MLKIGPMMSSGTHLILKSPTQVASRGNIDAASQKSLGETPPIILSLSEIGSLASLFASTGILGRLRRRLNYLKNKNCRLVPAKGTTACIDDKDVVYVGVDFLREYQGDPETLAGVLAHEWGHSCAMKPGKEEIQELTWDEIFELRRAHETLADEISGRLLCLMGYQPDGVIGFLSKGKDTHNLKYHAPEIRAQVIQYGFEAEKRKGALAKQLFPGTTYKNQYHTVLLDIA